jgi:nucleoid-associated protein YgaU
MSVATEFPPEVYLPGRARPEQDATVLPFRTRRVAGERAQPTETASPETLRGAARAMSRLYPVSAEPAGSRARAGEAPLRLTRRGYVVLGLLAATLVAGLLWLAHTSGPAGPAPPAVGAVTVRDGDTLWSIASRIAPQRDPRLVVVELEDVNHLSSPVLQPGQVLRTR